MTKRGTDGEVEAKDNQGGVGKDSTPADLYVEDAWEWSTTRGDFWGDALAADVAKDDGLCVATTVVPATVAASSNTGKILENSTLATRSWWLVDAANVAIDVRGVGGADAAAADVLNFHGADLGMFIPN